MRDSSLTGYTAVKMPVQQPINPLIYWPGAYSKPQVPDSGTYYFKIDSVATGTDKITINSTITANYTGQLFDATLFDSGFNGGNIATEDINAFLVPALPNAFENYASVGTKISILIPSSLGYQLAPQANIPAFSCLRFTYTVLSVTP
jgi:FKBP-type peptidyl-prolyl cis-trans isomerase